MTKHKTGDIFQINPETHPLYGGSFIVATEVKEWGIQGYLSLTEDYTGLVRFKGVAYLRINWEHIYHIGHVEWELKHRDGDETDTPPG